MNNGNITQRKALAAAKQNQSSSYSTSTNVNSSNAKGQQQSAAQNAPSPGGATQAPEIGLPHEDNPRAPGNTVEVLREQPAINCKNEQGRRTRPGAC